MNIKDEALKLLAKQDLEIRFSRYVGELCIWDDKYIDSELERERIEEVVVGHNGNRVWAIWLVDADTYLGDIGAMTQEEVQQKLSDFIRSKDDHNYEMPARG